VEEGRGLLSREDVVEVVALGRRGWSVSAIARHSGRDRKTIRAWLAEGERRRRARAPSVLEPYRAYVERRFVDDPHLDATVLLRELRPLGFERSYQTLRRELRRLELRPACPVCKRGGHRLTIELPHEPGEELQLDWLELAETPWAEPAYVLVGALSHSGRVRAVVSDGMDFAHLVSALDGVLRRLGGTARCWRTDRMATLVEPGRARLRPEAASSRSTTGSPWLSVRRGGRSARAWSKPRSVTWDAHGGARHGWRRRRRRSARSTCGASRSPTSGAAARSPSRRRPRPSRCSRCRRPPTQRSCCWSGSSQRARWSASRATRYSVPPRLAGQTVTARVRVGEPLVQIVSAAGVLVASHHRLLAAAGQLVRSPVQQAALERAVLAAFTTRPRCARKPNRPPTAEALALATKQAAVDVEIPPLAEYARLVAAS
jgi:Mu transposase-like protein